MKRFGVALSFTGEKRTFVERVSDVLAQAMGKERVLYDRFHEAEFARLDLDVYLPSLYRSESELIVIFLCENYDSKRWCRLEFRHIKELIATEDQKRIMLISLDDGVDYSQLGVLSGDGYLAIRNRDPRQIAEAILERFQDEFGATKSVNHVAPEICQESKGQKFFGKKRAGLLSELKESWFSVTHTPVAAIQGIPGSGKTEVAKEIATWAGMKAVCLQVSDEEEERDFGLLTEILLAIGDDFSGKGAGGSVEEDYEKPLMKVLRVVQRHPIIIIIDEFQKIIDPDSGNVPDAWSFFLQRLSDGVNVSGKVLLASSRLLPARLWSEKIVCRVLPGLDEEEGVELLSCQIRARGFRTEVLEGRESEIAVRLGGNPRAIKTLVGGLHYATIEEIMGSAPAVGALDDSGFDESLLEKFERDVLRRGLPSRSSSIGLLLCQFAVHRLPFRSSFTLRLQIRIPEAKKYRHQLIDRFFVETSNGFDVVHPLVREICTGRLRESPENWAAVHSDAADYYTERFSLGQGADVSDISRSYQELRYHLFESGMMQELRTVDHRLRSFVLKRIGKSRVSQVPKSPEIIEERIALIDSLPSDERTRDLEFHLGLCYEQRGFEGDFERAIGHARNGVGSRVYYAAWLLLLRLENEVSGPEALIAVADRAIQALNGQGNAFSVALCCSRLLDRGNMTQEAVQFLRKHIQNQQFECRADLVIRCSQYLEELDQGSEAIRLIESSLGTLNSVERGPLIMRFTKLLLEAGRESEAFKALESGLAGGSVTNRPIAYIKASEYCADTGSRSEAIDWIRRGIEDPKVTDSRRLVGRYATLMVQDGRAEEAVSFLLRSISEGGCADYLPAIHLVTSLLEENGKIEEAIKIYGQALGNKRMSREVSIYVGFAKVHFRQRDLRSAFQVLEAGMQVRGMEQKEELYQMAGDVASRLGSPHDGVTAMKEGIKLVGNSNTSGLYHSAAKLLTKDGRIGEAIVLLREGVAGPALKNKAPLFQDCAKLLEREGRSEEAIALLNEALRIPGISAKVSIYHQCAVTLRNGGERGAAVDLLREAIDGPKIGNKVALYRLAIELLAKEGSKSDARMLLDKGLETNPNDKALNETKRLFNL